MTHDPEKRRTYLLPFFAPHGLHRKAWWDLILPGELILPELVPHREEEPEDGPDG